MIRIPYPEAVAVRLTWEPRVPLDQQFDGGDGRPTVFVHIRDDSGRVLRTFDHPLPADWEPGIAQSYTVDIAQSALAAPLAPGSYELTVGLYHVDWGYRWPLATPGSEVAKREYRVATVEVPDDPGPRFEFTSGWLPAESRDLQVPLRRRLAAEAGVRISGLDTPGTLLFALAVGAIHGEVVVRSDCDGTERRLDGSGTHLLEVDVRGPGMPTACSVEFRPGGALSGCGTACPAFLERAAFRADPG